MMTPILSYIFRMSCFETLFTIFCFTSNALYLHSLSRFFGIKYRSIAPKQIDYIYNGITFLSVQLTLDLILPKSYDGLHMPRFGFLVFERPIPELNDNNMNADILFEIIYPVFLCLVKITVALLLYDAFMYFIHRLQHSIPFLYRYTHQLHHGKGDTFGSVASRQDIIDRTVSILLANGCLHAVHANPYERVVFIVLFVALLVDSHVEEYHHHHLNNNSNNNNDNLDHAWRSAWEAVLHHTVLHAPLVLPRVLAVLIRVSRRALAAHPVPGAAALYPVLGTPLVTETLAAVVMAMHRRCVLGALMDSPTAGGDVPWDRLRGVLEEGGGEEKTAVDVVMDTIRERLGVNLSDDDNTDNNNKNKGEEDNTDTTDNIGTERSGTTSSTMLRILLSEDSIIDQCGDVIHAAATTPPMTTSRHHHSSLSSTDALRVYLIDLAAALKSTPPYIALRSAAHPPPILHPDAVSRLLSYPVVRRALYAVPDADLAGLYLTLLRGCNTETERRERHEERREQLGKEIETIITW
eukprot:gb/GECH01010375.1/.p1 GENE.gb/GECH01010375.1/~~gb/GECH01010375.1/.p1  ORF type:complete len:523 (+),score=108.52 gb/GECH01010375.1/:1-1569(+)